jgi:S1-C subfamily serine protease
MNSAGVAVAQQKPQAPQQLHMAARLPALQAPLRPAAVAAAAPSSEGSPSQWQTGLASMLASVALFMATFLGSPDPVLAEPLWGGFGGAQQATLEMKTPDGNAAELDAAELQSVRLFQENTPSVVNISNIRVVRSQRGSFMSMDSQKMPVGQGSGFVWDRSGHIVTNWHVINNADDVTVTMLDQSVYNAKVVGGDQDKDVAVLQLLDMPPEKMRELKPVRLGTSSTLMVGQRVYAIGNPFGLDHTLTQGIVSGVGRELQTPGPRGIPIRNVIQTDAAINPGNSGGVLLDSKGRLIGINTAIADPSGRGASSGVGFAIPIDQVNGLVEQILTYGRIVRPVLGISIAPPQAVRQLGLEGVLVLEALPGTPAYDAGIRSTYRDDSGRLVLGDIITGFNGKPVKLQKDLFALLDDCKVGQEVDVTVKRGQRTETIRLRLADQEGKLSSN